VLGLAAWGCATTDAALLKPAAAGAPGSTAASGGPASSSESPTIIQTSAKENADSPVRGQKPDKAADRRPTSAYAEAPLKLTGEAAQARPVAVIVAAVNQVPIFDEEVKTALAGVVQPGGSQEQYNEAFKKALEHIIDREAVLQEAFANLEKGGKQGQLIIQKLNEEAEKSFEQNYLSPQLKRFHMHSREELAAAMETQNVSLDVIRRLQTREWLFQQYLVTRLESLLQQVGYRDIVKYYDGHPEEFQVAESVDWQDIYVESDLHSSRAEARRWAEHLAGRIRQGEDFLTLSKEYDNGDSRHRKGEGEGHLRGKIDPPALEAPLFEMSEGDVRVIEMGNGFHIVRLVKHQKAGPMPFDADVQKKIYIKLRNELFQGEMKRYVKKLTKSCAVWRAPPWGP
jgi:hypothetical protein